MTFATISSSSILGFMLAVASEPGNAEDHYVTLGRVAVIIGAVAVGAWTVRAKFDKVLHFMEESKEDRKRIHESLVRETELLHKSIKQIKVTLRSLKCNGNCPLDEDTPTEDLRG